MNVTVIDSVSLNVGGLTAVSYTHLDVYKRQTQDKADLDSAQLANALLNENLENTIYKYLFQRKLLMNLHLSLIHI